MQKRYKKKALLGKGATAQVFLVEAADCGKRYAMKVYENKNVLAREEEMLRKVTEASCENEKYFPQFIECLAEENAIVMEYVEGQDLQAFLDKEQCLGVEETVGIMEEILNALEVLHKQQPAIIYRDLKPANIMLCRDGSVKLIDLGAACFAEAENNEAVHAGTYGYAAPEQFWDGVKPEKTCDIYSAGKVLAYLLTGKNPAHPPYDVEQYCKGMKKVPAEFLKIINRSLAKEPQARFADCESMKRAVRNAYDACRRKKGFRRRGKTTITYEKCIWMSEYRRIF